MEWIVIGLVALLATPLVIGFCLPERFTGSTRVVYDRSPQEVWDALEDVERHPMTGRMMKALDHQPDVEGRPSWVEDMGHGEKITVTTAEREAPRRLVRDMASAAVPMTSRWEYILEPVDGGCAVTVEGETFIRRGTWHVPLFRFMMKVGGGVKKGLDIQLDMVAGTLGTEARRD